MTHDIFEREINNTSPLLEYVVKGELMGIDPLSSELREDRVRAMKDPVIAEIISELKKWPGSTLKRHNDAKLLIHKLSFLADLGFTIEDEGLEEIIESIMVNKTSDGIYTVKINIPKHFGGTGEDQFSWMLCDAPLLLYSLLKMGVNREKLEDGLNYLIGLGSDIGYSCAASPDLGRFNGPGKRGTLCPYADLLMVKLFSQLPGRHSDKQCRDAVEALLDHADKKDKRYLFGVGTDFRKLKYPFIWYDILHVADALSHFDYAVSDPRFLELMKIIKSKTDSEGLYRAESVWMAWKQLDSGQKKKPSMWITFIVLRIMGRLEEWE